MGDHFEALDEGVLMVPLDPRYTQVGFNLLSVQVCAEFLFPRWTRVLLPLLDHIFAACPNMGMIIFYSFFTFYDF